MLWKCHSIFQQIWKTAVVIGLGKVSFHSSLKERQCQRMFKQAQLHSSHTLANKCSKFSKPGFNSMWTMNFQLFKLDLEKVEEPETKLSTSVRSSKKQESSKKTPTSASLTMPNPLCGSQPTVKNSSRDTRPPHLLLKKSVCRSGSNS